MNRTYIDYIADIYDAIEKIEQFIAGMDYDAFVHDGKTIYAVIRAINRFRIMQHILFIPLWYNLLPTNSYPIAC